MLLCGLLCWASFYIAPRRPRPFPEVAQHGRQGLPERRKAGPTQGVFARPLVTVRAQRDRSLAPWPPSALLCPKSAQARVHAAGPQRLRRDRVPCNSTHEGGWKCAGAFACSAAGPQKSQKLNAAAQRSQKSTGVAQWLA